ncbi:hypothetical protein CAEBREN_08897 [Caenorhabditis brenneri]|uniref:Uncharacterized protein n=1 Tax=Caenorhabditis brenneri TaxID=135651 RepID=G0MR78_CAEBE|nr:hypothetical protein CAEBREN_08897 [Caenorhabditis brenneri]
MTQTYHLVTRIFYDDCDLLVSARKCVIIRLFQSFSSAFFHNFYVAVSCHSFFSIFNWYKDGYARFWGYLAFLIALGGTSPSYLVDKDSDDYMLNCSSFEHKTKSVQMQIFRLFMFVDLASVLSLSLLKLYRYLEDRLGYHLSKKHRKLELDRVMFLIGPNFLLNVICCLYLDIVSLYATTEEKLNGNLFIWANSVPLYIFLSPIVWFKTLSKQENRTSPEAVPSIKHFDVLEGFWHFHERNRRKKVAEWRVRMKRNKNKEPKVSVAVIDVESNKASEIA